MKLADISKYQGDINFEAIDGIDAFIIRAGYRGYGNGIIYRDTKLDRNIEGAERTGKPFGLYFYSQAINASETMLEAQWLLRQRQGHQVLFLALDMELTGSGAGRADFLRRETRQNIADVFSKCIRDADYQPIIYSNEAYWVANLNYNSPNYMNWVRNWSREPSIPYEIWQYTNHGKIIGIEKEVDLNKSELTIDDFTGKDTTYKTFKAIKDEIKKISDLVTNLEGKLK